MDKNAMISVARQWLMEELGRPSAYARLAACAAAEWVGSDGEPQPVSPWETWMLRLLRREGSALIALRDTRSPEIAGRSIVAEVDDDIRAAVVVIQESLDASAR